VDSPKAVETLKIALDAWKTGKKTQELKAATPSIVVQDMDWDGGSKLLDYQITGPGTEQDANLRCPVKLTLRDPQGQEVKKDVSYIVGTDPVLTVFRALY
jgi:hypothetical protein